MFILPSEPQSIPRVIYNGLKLWTHSYLDLLLLSFLAVLIGAIPHFFLPALNTRNIHIILQFFWANAIYVPIYLIISLFFMTTIFYRLNMFIKGESGGIYRAFVVAFQRLPWVLLAAIIQFVSIMIGLILIIPGFIILIALIMYQPLVIVDKEGPIEAYKHSCRLVWPHWWRTFAVMALTSITFYFFLYLIEKFTLSLWVVTHPHGEIWVSYNLFNIILNTLYYPLICSVILVLLHDLKLRYVRFSPLPSGEVDAPSGAAGEGE